MVIPFLISCLSCPGPSIFPLIVSILSWYHSPLSFILSTLPYRPPSLLVLSHILSRLSPLPISLSRLVLSLPLTLSRTSVYPSQCNSCATTTRLPPSPTHPLKFPIPNVLSSVTSFNPCPLFPFWLKNSKALVACYLCCPCVSLIRLSLFGYLWGCVIRVG
ncbi:hypothetical protein K474DRAFT_1427659 [Panus rudis PR-1116 ss-1]|nr:hypothetical protein K474DRAFT_1427659 [Panus rudis PR-1116 ss-1]